MTDYEQLAVAYGFAQEYEECLSDFYLGYDNFLDNEVGSYDRIMAGLSLLRQAECIVTIRDCYVRLVTAKYGTCFINRCDFFDDAEKKVMKEWGVDKHYWGIARAIEEELLGK